MVENGGFERGGIAPDSWSLGNEGSDDGRSSGRAFNGRYSLMMKGGAGRSKYAVQKIPVSGSEKDIYIASCWAWAEAVPDAEDKARKFELYIKVIYTDGTIVEKDQTGAFNRDVAGWQRTSVAFDLDDGSPGTERAPEKIQVGLRYYKQANTAYFDNVQLVRDVAQSYTYDKEGNLITAKENGESVSSLSYSEESDLIAVRDEGNNLYEYKYNDAHQVTEAESPMGTKILFTYTEEGAVEDTVISSSGGTMQIKTEKEYNEASGGISAGTYVTKEKDADGYPAEYTYDLQSGELVSVTAPDGTETGYAYEEDSGRLKKVTSADRTVGYGYDASGTALASISHNGFLYEFSYDIYGNLTGTSAAGRQLATNQYGRNDGALEKTEYGNGDDKEYVYDKAGNLIQVKENGKTTASWNYDLSGLPVWYKDHVDREQHVYSYDHTGRLLEEKVLDMDALAAQKNSRLYVVRYSYDEYNDVEKKIVTAGGRNTNVSYRYNADRQPSEMGLATGRKVSYSYDSLGRLSDKSVSLNTPLEYDYVYTLSKRNAAGGNLYRTVKAGNELIGDRGYHYQYDTMGNIISVQEGTRAGETESLTGLVTKITYKYDSQRQLIRENNLYLDRTIVYTYDNGGNITKKQEYAYTTASDLSAAAPLDTVEYRYDSTWKDKLVSYDGQGVTYDGMGNPLTYRGKSMTWKGRELERVTEDGTASTYSYDAEGKRIRKTVGDVEHSYYYADGLLAYESYGSRELYFTYEADGTLCRIRYINGSSDVTYYPALNMRGDVEAIYNYNGEIVARYIYDSWGKVLSVEDADGNAITDASHIGNVNPVRYRGYYYDAEMGFYYLNSRYYDPEVGRFISADTTDILGVSSDLYDKNLYAYCDNNPITRKDSTGAIWETVIDVGSLACSVVEVALNPGDVWAWAGMVGDAVDLIPFVTGIGESVKIARASNKMDDVVAAAKALKKKVKISDSVGTYEIVYASGKNYVGKGPYSRAIESAVNHTKKIPLNDNLGDTVTSIRWKATKTPDKAFKEEFALQTYRSVRNVSTYNINWSPGKKLYNNLRRY